MANKKDMKIRDDKGRQILTTKKVPFTAYSLPQPEKTQAIDVTNYYPTCTAVESRVKDVLVQWKRIKFAH